MKISIVSSEAAPFAKTGGLADTVTSLAKALSGMGHEMTMMLPNYAGIRVPPMGLISPLTMNLGGKRVSYSIVESVFDGIRLVLIDCPPYYFREGLYADSRGEYGDNDERFVLFTRACLEYYKRKGERPDVFHCHDWQTGLLPLFLRTHYFHDDVSKAPVVFTVHNMGFQGNFPSQRFSLLGIGGEFFTSDTTEFYGKVSFLKSGLVFSDILTTVSRRYCEEIQTPELGAGMHGVLLNRKDVLFGIQNGIDQNFWNPVTDPAIAKNYSAEDIGGKDDCRRVLLTEFDLDPDSRLPVVGIISRLVPQKGIELIMEIADEIIDSEVYLIVLGAGEEKYETYFRTLSAGRPNRVGIALRYDTALAHRILAGSDIFLMPSKYEPSGLNHIYSLRYGSVPVVRATGGLDDLVEDWDESKQKGNGFKFVDFSGEALREAFLRARRAFDRKEVWRILMETGMKGDYSWKKSAMQYWMLYEQAGELKS